MNLRSLSPLPVVDLRAIDTPADGLLLATPPICTRMFNKNDLCRRHYARIVTDKTSYFQVIQCPHGFSSIAADIYGELCCLTSFIPFPRAGGEAERRLAKSNRQSKLSMGSVRKAVDFLLAAGSQLAGVQREAVQAQSLSLHEIRKLNRTVKHEAERLCRAESSDNLELANPAFVKIWKTAELMSAQFDVIELLANEELFKYPLNSEMELYRLVDKCARIYRPPGQPNRLILKAPPKFYARIRAFDKTIQMIPTALIENALKYSLPNSQVVVELLREDSLIALSVQNDCRATIPLTDDVFRKGVRRSDEQEGSGNGLYLAMKVAQQHDAKLQLSSTMLDSDTMRCDFTVVFPELLDAG